jgi:hypothetical protein
MDASDASSYDPRMSAAAPQAMGPSSIQPREVLGLGSIDIDAVARHLDTLREDQRVAFVRALDKPDMLRLWGACEGRQVSADDFVPPALGMGREVIHEGRNSLPVLWRFQKRFARAEREGVVYGYNHSDLGWAYGPGYFVGHVASEPRGAGLAGVFGIDYYEVPPAHALLPPGWPKVRKNEVGLQCLVFAKMVDYMLKVSEGVTIGRAWKRGQQTSNLFVLARTGV